MKKIIVSLVFVSVLASVLFAQRVTYKDDRGGTLLVGNLLDDNVVLFLGAVNKRNFLGGVLGGNERLIDIRSKLSGNSSAVLIRAVKEETFKKKKYNVSPEDVIFAKIVVYDKGTRGFDASIRVSSSVGGDVGLRIENNSAYALELRVDKPDGPVFTTFSPRERARIISMEANPRGYMFFPTYIFYDPFEKQLSSITTRSLEGGQSRRPVDLTSRDGMPLVSFNGPTDNDLPVHPVSYVTLINQTSREVAILKNGGNELSSQKGNIMINPGDIETYEIAIAPASVDSLLITALLIDRNKGPNGYVKLAPVTFKRGVDYILHYVENGGAYEARIEEVGERGFDLDELLQLANE